MERRWQLVKALSKVRTENQALNRVQDNMSAVTDFIQLSPLVGPLSLVEAEIEVTPTSVAHKLGRPIRGYIVVRQDAAANVYEPEANSSPTLFVTLQATAPVTVSIIFF